MSTSTLQAGYDRQHFVTPSSFATTPLRRAITAACRIPEPEAVAHVVAEAGLSPDLVARSRSLALRLAGSLRDRGAGGGRSGLVQNLLQEYALSSQEGIALMCLAEALLRIPDAATRDALIRDKISLGQWQTHLGRSPSLFVNAATWGLLITGKLVSTHSETGLSAAIGRMVAAGGEPLIRKSVDLAMRMMGEQFVTGESIGEALKNSREREAQGFRYSYDMLGEAALTAHDAARYLREYEQAIHAIGRHSAGRGILDGPGISIKLSALHPRYSRAQYPRIMTELYPVLVRLCVLAKRYDLCLNIDAEEAERLELSLDLLERLALEPSLKGWDGLGFVIQAYQKRCPWVVDCVIDLARRARRRLMIRLVKGAYWDSEIKRAQVDGLDGYPVYTRKPYTDAAYIACARKLLAAPDAVYPQFATHNAATLATVYELAGPDRYSVGQYEFQCLHGMGEPLYEQVVGSAESGGLGRPCRIYAPVGTHETLLAYLVRRLLENGANTSFVNRIADESIPVDELVRDPFEQISQSGHIEGATGLPHPLIPLPRDLYGTRANSHGLDLASEAQLQSLAESFGEAQHMAWASLPMLARETGEGPSRPVLNPADRRDEVGTVREATPEDVDLALEAAQNGAAAWAGTSPAERARLLELAAMNLETDAPHLMGLLIREAGKTAANALSEVREAVDFLRYYAAQVRDTFDNGTHRPLGPVVCISPWNFPLAIFMGQISAALAAGNVVLAKPAEQTPLIAAAGVRALLAAGVPRSAVQLLPGEGAQVGARLVADQRVRGVVFTGSTEVARILQRSLVGRVDEQGHAVALIAETGGQNAMIVDSSALAEQVVGDVLTSAFDSAGQRCSALRVLCVQEEAADRILEMLLGAMAELKVGYPGRLATDVGPVIDEEARRNIERHLEHMRARGARVQQIAGHCEDSLEHGTFVLPTLIEINSLSELSREVFGPVLHFLRYRREQLGELLDQIHATGYGLTLGLHTRIDETIHRVTDAARVGNLYVNRNMVGAVVGVQPFGGEGLSGTGPKAGGPLYLYRLLSRAPGDVLSRALPPSEQSGPAGLPAALGDLLEWIDVRHGASLLAACRQVASHARVAESVVLPGPTGERNVYRVVPRGTVLCIARSDADRLLQLTGVLAVGGQAAWPATAQSLLQQLPARVRDRVSVVRDWRSPEADFQAVLLHGDIGELGELQAALARREGAIVPVERLRPEETGLPLDRLVHERSLSINTAAAGGNASLMTLD